MSFGKGRFFEWFMAEATFFTVQILPQKKI
jgi:hypothetical protein